MLSASYFVHLSQIGKQIAHGVNHGQKYNLNFKASKRDIGYIEYNIQK